MKLYTASHISRPRVKYTSTLKYILCVVYIGGSVTSQSAGLRQNPSVIYTLHTYINAIYVFYTVCVQTNFSFEDFFFSLWRIIAKIGSSMYGQKIGYLGSEQVQG